VSTSIVSSDTVIDSRRSLSNNVGSRLTHCCGGTSPGMSPGTRTQCIRFLLFLNSKRWRLQSGCNHWTVLVDRWKGWESSELLTNSPHAALGTEAAHQDLKKSKTIYRSYEKWRVWPRSLSIPSSGRSKRPKTPRKSHSGLQWLCVTPEWHSNWLARLLAETPSQ